MTAPAPQRERLAERKKRVRTIEHEHGYGWIARHPVTGDEIVPNFRWSSRSVARAVVAEALMFVPMECQP